MKFIRFLIKILFVVFFLFQMSFLVALADDTDITGGILPGTTTSVKDCNQLMNEVSMYRDCQKINLFSGSEDIVDIVDGLNRCAISDGHTPIKVLACGIKTGQMRLWMIPYYIRYILEFVIGIAGIVAVGGVIYGGYLYLFAGLLDDKENGKKAIMYGVVGMILTLVAWAFVNIVISVVTA